jgi:hypothetical protein
MEEEKVMRNKIELVVGQGDKVMRVAEEIRG